MSVGLLVQEDGMLRFPKILREEAGRLGTSFVYVCFLIDDKKFVGERKVVGEGMCL